MTLLRFAILGIALLAGGIAAYVALNMATAPTAPTVVELAPQIQTQEVLVAAADIDQGQKLTPENVRWQQWPDDATNSTYIQKQTMPDALVKLEGSVVRSAIAFGEPIREVKLARPESGFLSAVLPSGMRAVAVSVSANNTAGGFILPNDRVDVIMTLGLPNAPSGAPSNISHTILTNIRVLAIDQTPQEKDGEPTVVGKTATLELDPKQAELITEAETSGRLSLTLRSYADVTDDITTSSIPTPEPVPETTEPAPSAEATSGVVKVFRGGTVSFEAIDAPAGGGTPQDLPRYDAQAYCREVAAAGGTYSEMIYGGCLDQEQSSYDAIAPKWSAIPPDVRNYCDEVARAAGPGSYIILRGCIDQELAAAAENRQKVFDY